jgi:hypothetical protein
MTSRPVLDRIPRSRTIKRVVEWAGAPCPRLGSGFRMLAASPVEPELFFDANSHYRPTPSVKGIPVF